MEKAAKRSAWTPDAEARYQERRIERARSGNWATLQGFAEWLREDRGLCQGTITLRVHSASSFIDGTTDERESCPEALPAVSVAAIEGFFVRYGQSHGPSARRSMRSAVRSFVEFAIERAWVEKGLFEAIPSLRSYRLNGVPRGVSDAEVSTLLGAKWNEGASARRDRAILVLLATYGVRRGQISALQLADLDWHARTIAFAAQKGGKTVQHSLTGCVAESLADYARNERPPSESSHVFLRARAPHLRLSPGAISVIVSSRMKRAGLARRGAHAFRHAFATRLLRTGQPVKAIADLLGHRSLDTVAIYAKVDHPRLLEVAAEWPEIEP